MADIFDVIDPAELTAYARLNIAAEDRPENEFIFERWLPNETVARRKAKWKTGTTKSYTDAAPFRPFTTPPRIGERPGQEEKESKMLPSSMQYPLTEEDVANIQAALDEGGELADDIQETIFNDVDAGMKAIENRLEIARSDALVNGQIDVDENGIVGQSADFARPAANEDTVGVDWGTPATAVPLTNEAAVMDVLKTKGYGPNDLVAVQTTATWRKWLATDQVRDAVPSARVYDTLSDDDGDEVRRSRRLPPVLLYDAEVNDVDGTLRSVMPDDKVLYLPANEQVGESQWGIPAIASDPDINLTRETRPGPVAYLYRLLPEYVVWTVVDAIMFPTFRAPELTFVLDTSP